MFSVSNTGWLLLKCFIILLFFTNVYGQFKTEKECFCKMDESVDNCACSNSSLDFFNNENVFPALKNLLQRDFFKFYKVILYFLFYNLLKVNMEKPCPFWPDDRKCSSKECSIGYCDDEVPLAFKTPLINFDSSKEKKTNNKKQKENECLDKSNQFDPLDRSLSEGDKAQLRDIDIYDDTGDNKFCEVDGINCKIIF